MTHAVSPTGLFHALVDEDKTACGRSVAAEPDALRLMYGSVAETWLAKRPWDLCSNCKLAKEGYRCE